MNPLCKPAEHISRRAFLKGSLLTAGGVALPNWGGLVSSETIAAEAAKKGKRCILLWMAGGASQMETFDLKPGRPLIRSLRIASKQAETILEGVVPVTFVTVTRAHDSEPCFTSSGHFSFYVDRAVAG